MQFTRRSFDLVLLQLTGCSFDLTAAYLWQLWPDCSLLVAALTVLQLTCGSGAITLLLRLWHCGSGLIGLVLRQLCVVGLVDWMNG